MRLIKKTAIMNYVETDYGTFEYSDLVETLENLVDTEPLGHMLILYNNGMEKWFLAEGIICKVIRGGVYSTDKLGGFLNKVYALGEGVDKVNMEEVE